MCRPRLSQRKSQIRKSSHNVISVGNSAARPERKNRRKSSEKVAFLRTGVEAEGVSSLKFTSTPSVPGQPRHEVRRKIAESRCDANSHAGVWDCSISSHRYSEDPDSQTESA